MVVQDSGTKSDQWKLAESLGNHRVSKFTESWTVCCQQSTVWVDIALGAQGFCKKYVSDESYLCTLVRH